VKCSPDDLKPGRLGEFFRNGAKAVVLGDDHRVGDLWEALMGGQGRDAGTTGDAAQAWESSVLDLARNHRAGDMQLGDMLRFIPGHYAYIARKMKVLPRPDGHALQTIPDFWTGNKRVTPSEETLRTVWELMTDILRSTWPDDREPPPYAVVVELLKYPPASADLDKVFSLLADVSGRWARLGQRLDAHKSQAAGPFDVRGIRDLFAWASVTPGAGLLFQQLNRFFSRFGLKGVPGQTRLIGDPHADSTKAVSALASDRDVIRTEVWDGRNWVELHLTPGSLAIFPSRKLVAQLGIMPTWHRILLTEPATEGVTRRLNATLSLGIVDR
jgi:hypothetical protein